MTQKGNHTWDIIHQYHSCPQCKRIMESRQDFTYRLGEYVKDCQCPYCKKEFTLVKPSKPGFGPFFGDGETFEWEWK